MFQCTLTERTSAPLVGNRSHMENKNAIQCKRKQGCIRTQGKDYTKTNKHKRTSLPLKP